MSYYPNKKMYRDENGVDRFLDPGTAPPAGKAKRWFRGEVVRKLYNGKDEVIKKSRQVANVFAFEDEVPGLVACQCPDPFQGVEAARTSCKVYYRPLREEDNL